MSNTGVSALERYATGHVSTVVGSWVRAQRFQEVRRVKAGPVIALADLIVLFRGRG